MNGDKTLANIACANRGEQEERFARLELEKQELEGKCSRLEEHFKSIKEDKEFYQKQAYKLEERVEELEEKYSRSRESFKKQTTNAFDGWEKVIELEKENENYEQALEFGIKYLQASNIGQIQLVVQAMEEALGE